MAAADAAGNELLRDPYEVLGVERNATAQELKSAYRRLALLLHPDKNQGASAETAAEKFKEVATAYGILEDPDKRRRYDAGGYSSLEKADLEVEVDLSSLGAFNTAVAAMFSRLGVPIKTAVAPMVEVDLSSLGAFNTAVAAMFSRLGVPIKTTVAPMVLEAAYEGKFEAAPLRFGEAITARVAKAGCQFYTLDLEQRHIDAGFCIGAHSVAGSKFKLLMFEATEAGQWELLLQEDSTKVRKSTQIAGLYFLHCDTFRVGPKPTPLETADFPENGLFRRLDTMAPREKPVASLRPGVLLLAVYGDNWFKRASYTIEAVLPGPPAAASSSSSSDGRAEAGSGPAGSSGQGPGSSGQDPPSSGAAVERVRGVEAELLKRRDELRAFEAAYRQAQTRYMEAVEKFGQVKEEVDALLTQRDDAYLELLAVPSPSGGAPAPGHHAAPEDGGHLQANGGPARPKSLFSFFANKS